MGKGYKPFILGVNGSPHNDGVVARLLDRVLDGAKRAGAETRRVDLYELRIVPEPGLYSEKPDSEVPENMPADDIRALYPEIIRADGLVLATPNYWANMSGVMKDFIDHLTALENKDYAIEGKVGTFLAASKENEGGLEMAAANMAFAMSQMGVLIPPNGIMWHPGNWGSVKNWAWKAAPIQGRLIVDMVKVLKKNPVRWSLGSTGLLGELEKGRGKR